MSRISENMLTFKQKLVFSAITNYINENNIPPTVREIGEVIGEKTPGAVQGILNRLEKKGVITRETGMARSIKLVNDSPYPEVVHVPLLKQIKPNNIDDLFSIYNIIENGYIPMNAFKYTGCFAIYNPDPYSFKKYRDSTLIFKDLRYTNIDTKAFGTIPIKLGDILLLKCKKRVVLRQYEGNTLSISNFTNNEILEKCICEFNVFDDADEDIGDVSIVGMLCAKLEEF